MKALMTGSWIIMMTFASRVPMRGIAHRMWRKVIKESL